MSASPLSVHPTLQRSSRLGLSIGQPPWSLVRDGLLILAAGVFASACVHFLDFSLRIPGHALLRSILPISLGLALVPRHMSGTLIGASAYAATMVFRSSGAEPVGMGAMTSMLLVGPMLDVALWSARGGWTLYLRCAAAGLAVNLLAFAVRSGGKLAAASTLTLRPLADWWSYALATHIACGIVAGALAGWMWFRCQRSPMPAPKEQA